MTYSVTTEIRTYNSVDSLEHFEAVRENWKDHTPIQCIWLWTETGWQSVDIGNQAAYAEATSEYNQVSNV